MRFFNRYRCRVAMILRTESERCYILYVYGWARFHIVVLFIQKSNAIDRTLTYHVYFSIIFEIAGTAILAFVYISIFNSKVAKVAKLA
jgi:hypothetical protein